VIEIHILRPAIAPNPYIVRQVDEDGSLPIPHQIAPDLPKANQVYEVDHLLDTNRIKWRLGDIFVDYGKILLVGDHIVEEGVAGSR
jgi:hypothetical protein